MQVATDIISHSSPHTYILRCSSETAHVTVSENTLRNIVTPIPQGADFEPLCLPVSCINLRMEGVFLG